jgi:2-dehydro-3-deoxyphosphogluconate aldolase / (4S)-4-hydroxy-2-oxoglutarate aldolase
MTKQESIHRLLNPGVVAVIRADSSAQLLNICTALAEGGLTGMEITMTTPNALEAIKEVTTKLGSRIYMGVGSVTKEEIIRCCNRYSKPIVCGAYTPTEALNAYELGADFIKIFPADGLGPNYIKALKAPMPQLQLIPTGGVDVNTCADFIKAGCAAVAAGSSLLKKDLIEKQDWKGLSALAAQFVANVAQARAQLKK